MNSNDNDVNWKYHWQAFTDYMEELREVLMDMFDISHLSNPRFVMFAISNVLLYSW